MNKSKERPRWKPNDCITCGEPCANKQCRECYEKEKHKGKVCKIYANRKRRKK